ncbi:hypothetical protein [Rhodococcus aetherivorans]|uniref:hypothetical protein n=1 Tax=Rhodococcus aetherivorans TaxID=191292 RepID=UPI0002D226DB|nr:hypothetical protein [Rhodococcus aetherivorans]CCW12898.1 hypothetical protein EBESD8_34500 [Rhodococcus aetherivorans]
MHNNTRIEVAAGQFTVEEFAPGELLIESRPIIFTDDGCGYTVSVPYYVRSEDAGVLEINLIGPTQDRTWGIIEIERQAKALVEVQAFYDLLGWQFPFFIDEYWSKLG